MNLDRHLFTNRHALILPSFGKLTSLVFNALSLWYRRIEERRQLLEMSDEILRDVGLSRADIQREAAKPFWRN